MRPLNRLYLLGLTLGERSSIIGLGGPLKVSGGFKSSNQENTSMTDAIFSTQVKGGGKMYFFDVKQAQKGKQSKFLQVTESRLQDGQPKRSSITLFPEQIQAFVAAFKESIEKVG